MLLTTAQINVCHKLDEIKDLEVKFMEKQLELVNEWKLLGVTIDHYLDWESYINKLTKACYATFLILKKLKKDTLPFMCRNN